MALPVGVGVLTWGVDAPNPAWKGHWMNRMSINVSFTILPKALDLSEATLGFRLDFQKKKQLS